MEDPTQAVQTTGDGAAQTVAAPSHQPDVASAVGPSAALVPQTYEQLERFCDTVAHSQMVPKQYRGEPQDVMVTVMHGMEVGLKPLQALQNITVINGKPSVYGDAAIALVRASGLCAEIKETIEEGGELAAICYARRKDNGDESTHAFSVTDAKEAGLWSKPGPWQDYPKRMLQMRARSWVLRDLFPDVLQGLYIAEEARDIPSEDEKRDRKYEKLLSDMRERLSGAAPEDYADVEARCKDYIKQWPPEQQGKAEALIANVRAARSGDVGEVPAEAEIVEGYDEQTFDEDLEALEEDLAQAMGADTREARLEQVSAAVAAFSEAHPEPSDDQREAILEVYEPVRAELTQEGEAGEEESAANDILEGNTALDTEADAGDGDADEEDG
jgi:hypothetical protein